MDETGQKRTTKALDRRDYLMDTINHVASILLQSGIDNFTSDLHRCMGMIAKAVDVDFISVWKNENQNNEWYSRQIFKWPGKIKFDIADTPENIANITEQINDEKSPRVYRKTFPNLEETLLKGTCINSLVRDMPAEEQKFFSSSGIIAVFIVPIFILEQPWGFVSYSNFYDEQLFTENEQVIMRSGSLVIANALRQNSMMLNLKAAAIQREDALKDAEKASNAKSEFLANMSHEMRTPLNAVIGLSALSLENKALDEEIRLNIEKIHNSGMTLLGLVNDILDISKVESGKLELVQVEYDVPSLINDTVTQNIFRIGGKPIEFKLDIDGNIFTQLYGDELRVKQIMNNLLSNAIKYTKEGTVELSVSCIQEDDVVWLVVKVSDTGRGIKTEDMGRLFSNYTQLDLESNRKIEGTGLGLVITKELARMMNGSITVESEYGKGSIFTVKLMQKFVTETTIGPEVVESLKKFHYSDSRYKKYTQLERISLPYARVLVVDDNQTNLEVAKGLMKPYKMQIDCVDDGQKAVDAIRDAKLKYNAVFMDHMMPGMDGIEAARHIREIDTDYAKNLPIIALTANAIVGNEEMFLNSGFQAFLSKPIDLVQLDRIVRQWVRDPEKEPAPVYKEPPVDARPGGAEGTLDCNIDGLNAVKGLERFGGDEKVYLEVLRSYVLNTPPLIKSIRNADENSLANYSIVIHGIKGASRSIGADEVGDMAAALEASAKAGDLNFVKSCNRAFIETLEQLLEEISFSICDNVQPSIEINAEFVRNKLSNLVENRDIRRYLL